ncbi:MAG TPA: hypothetical protein VGH59_15865 [Casimicrobiaceae bacterium]
MIRFISLLVVLGLAWSAFVDAQAPAVVAPASPAAAKSSLDVLKGIWIRPDGSYTIAIKSVAENGQLEAMYFNPNQLPFAKAVASRDAGVVRASFELRAGGYEGSTYELSYDPSSDRLKGIYYQAVAKQKFEVYFARKQAAQ